MATQAEIEAATDAAAAKPQQMTADGISVTNRSTQDLIAYEKYRKETSAAANGRLGVRFFNTKPPGAT
jgi:hypothetical protein